MHVISRGSVCVTHGFFVATVYGQQKRDEQVARAVLGSPRILRGACGGGRGERQEDQADQEGGVGDLSGYRFLDVILVYRYFSLWPRKVK